VKIDVVTLFPEMVQQAAGVGVTGRAQERGLWRLRTWNPRDFATTRTARWTTGPTEAGRGW
jgi:tRNA (guanine37-N1)-methyltransferase